MGKSVVTGFSGKIEDLGNHEFKFTIGDNADIIIIDGKEHPTKHGNMRTFTQAGPKPLDERIQSGTARLPAPKSGPFRIRAAVGRVGLTPRTSEAGPK
jgi:hypothetical protein